MYNSGSWNQLKLSIQFKGTQGKQYSVDNAKDLFMDVVGMCTHDNGVAAKRLTASDGCDVDGGPEGSNPKKWWNDHYD